MRIAYLDCFSGVSGDMMLAALVDVGADVGLLEQGINSLNIEPVRLKACTKVIKGIRSIDLCVDYASSQILRHLADAEQLLSESELSSWVKERSLAAFRQLAEAEARVHGLPVEKVHFHEVGALDTIADIVGSFLALEQLGIEKVFASPLPWSRGFLSMAHGLYPLPAPATAELLRGIPCGGVDTNMELVTPTGAALLRVSVQSFGPLPPIIPERVGYGAGKKERPDTPNLLRVIVGQEQGKTMAICRETTTVIEAQVDDMNPEHFSWLAEKLAASPALDYYFTPVYMKKGRPGTLITVICPPTLVSNLAEILFSHTSTLGLRYWATDRLTLKRDTLVVKTRWGPAQVKIAYSEGRPPKVAPEYEDCRTLALAQELPLDTVYSEVLRHALNYLEKVEIK